MKVSDSPSGVQPVSKTAVGVTNSGQSAITFAGAPVFVTLVWKVIGTAVRALATSKLCTLALSILISMAIYAVSEAQGENARDKLAGFTYAFINSFAIAATVPGIESAVTLP